MSFDRVSDTSLIDFITINGTIYSCNFEDVKHSSNYFKDKSDDKNYQ